MRERTISKSSRLKKLREEILSDVFSLHKEWKGNAEITNEWSIYRLLCNTHPAYRNEYADKAFELGVIRGFELADLKYIKK